jgi:hypothetical protein
MKFHKFFSLALVLLFTFQNSLSQKIDVSGNWYKEIKGIDDVYTRYDFKKYTISDVAEAKKRFQLITRSLANDEWEGVYTGSMELGSDELHWNTNGFVFFAVYHTLSALDFGDSKINPDSVELISRKSSFKRISDNLIKVRIGKKHYLVPENRLQDFAERAVGLSTDISDFTYYWSKLNEVDIEDVGSPVLPPKYKNYLRFPINTTITQVGKRQIHQNKFDDGTINYEEIYRFVILGAGNNKGIKRGMNFFVEDLGEWIEITKVLSSSSLGKIRRSFYEKEETCLDDVGGSGQTIPCKEIKTGMKAKTKISPNYF